MDAKAPSHVRTQNHSGFIQRLQDSLSHVAPRLNLVLDFKYELQRENLHSLINDIRQNIDRYEDIYPYIKEICRNQTINPEWYPEIENVLNWALKKGRGRQNKLNEDILYAWTVYIVVLSCAMIDKEWPSNLKKGMFLSGEKGKIYGIMGSN